MRGLRQGYARPERANERFGDPEKWGRWKRRCRRYCFRGHVTVNRADYPVKGESDVGHEKFLPPDKIRFALPVARKIDRKIGPDRKIGMRK